MNRNQRGHYCRSCKQTSKRKKHRIWKYHHDCHSAYIYPLNDPPDHARYSNRYAYEKKGVGSYRTYVKKNRKLAGVSRKVWFTFAEEVSFPVKNFLDEWCKLSELKNKVTPESPVLEQSPQYTIHPVSGEIVDFEIEFYDTRPSVNLPVLDIETTDDALAFINNTYAEQLATAPTLEMPVKE